MRDARDMNNELMFHAMWGTPMARAFGRTHETHRTLKSEDELRGLPEVATALMTIEQGGFPEAVIRMLVLMADDRKGVRRDRLERSSRVLTEDEPFASLGGEARAAMISRQTLIASYEHERAIETLPLLLRSPEERDLAIQTVFYVPGAIDEMAAGTLAILHRFCDVLGVPRRTETVVDDPLRADKPADAADPVAKAVPTRSRRTAPEKSEVAE